MPPRTRRILLPAAFFFTTCAVAGSLISNRVAAQSATEETTLRDSLHQFTDVYSVIEQNYAEKLTGDKPDKAIYDGAIPAMLHVLDPHSNFYDPKAFAAMREEQHGKYYGVGMSIQPQPDKNGATKVVVLAPFEGTPSYKAGLRPGDVITAIDGKSTTGMDSASVASLLKGPKGTHVQVTISREGSPKPMSFDLVRDEIPRFSVDLAFLIKPNVGYMHVTQFMETTSREVGDALDRFEKDAPLQGLVLDLRANPGGLLNEAVNMSDKFLQKGQIVVSQKGRAFPDMVYRAAHGEQGPKFPIVVLVNRNTASAAEIVSGALQDHDRALIVGETTFGKGLVQTVFQITDDTGLALTTYHYYTPSGRLIQRNYDNVSLYDYYFVRDDKQQPADVKNREVKLTDTGRTVYGGGGITPDEKIANPIANPFQNLLFQRYAFFDFAHHYLANHTVSQDFQVDDAVLAQFKDFLKASNIDYTDNDINGVKDWITTQIKAEIFTSQFGQTQGLRVRAGWDPQVAKALTYMPEAQALEDRLKAKDSKTNLAQR